MLNIETNNIVKQEQDSTEETGDETIVDMADPAEEIVSSEPSQMDTTVSLAVMTDRTEVFHADTQTELKLPVSYLYTETKYVDGVYVHVVYSSRAHEFTPGF